ncbi:TRAP transporter substrate-binding protein [Alkalicoccus saliphilus]|jgi:TRAP-type transport system periplasmic protein|uniref:C4-dicarboxylate ABC transporter substrate-binding protein n=1 Tax=Alkalicoccus saliphilus TaxID=200989 RepID=A0A2T4U3M0_9BACI|nr:TRAP transporter substrate-binding protein [Alkalicoccus saliphilus]PTL38002.1 C4-dicarboxylate ABC transporter substrate-binding protein [Alkalicoccus saliphilus]
MKRLGGKEKFFFLAGTVSLSAFLAACGGGDENSSTEASGEGGEHTFTLTHITQTSHGWHDTAMKFDEELQELSDGRMDLEIYPAGEIGSEADMLQQMESGDIDFGIITNAYMSTRDSEFNAWFMPFVFEDLAEAVEYRGIQPAQDMLEGLSEQGFVGLDFIFAGNRHILNASEPVESPEQLAGQSIRITDGPAIQDFWDEVGAGPTAMPLPEVYTSLQTGVIDGIDIDLDALITENLYETADYLTMSNHMTWPAVVMMSEISHDGLSEEDQDIVREAMKNAIDWGVQDAVEREEANLAEAEELGMNINELDEEEFSEVKETLHQQYAEESDIIAEFLEETQ